FLWAPRRFLHNQARAYHLEIRDSARGILESSQATECSSSMRRLNSRACLILFLQQLLHNLLGGFFKRIPVDGGSCSDGYNGPWGDCFSVCRSVGRQI